MEHRNNNNWYNYVRDCKKVELQMSSLTSTIESEVGELEIFIG